MRQPYQPPKQSLAGQIVDVFVIVVLVFGALWAPAVLGLTGPGTVTKTLTSPTWDKLGQNPAMQHAWTQLGMTPDTAAPIILTRYDYKIEPLLLIVTILFVAAYFLFVILYSNKEYRDVIAERFGDDPGQGGIP